MLICSYKFLAVLKPRNFGLPRVNIYEDPTLVTTARQISGLELPKSLFQHMTFVGNEEEKKESDEVATLLSSELMNATIESARASQKDNDGDDDSEEEEEYEESQ